MRGKINKVGKIKMQRGGNNDDPAALDPQGCTQMVWSTRNYPPTMKTLPARVRRKAVDIGNKLLAEGYQVQRATYIAVSMAREWAEHDRLMRERNIHVIPHNAGWAVRHVQSQKPDIVFTDKRCALSYAVELARSEGVYVIAHDDSGAIEAHIRMTCRS
jgi:hypothetical protein